MKKWLYGIYAGLMLASAMLLTSGCFSLSHSDRDVYYDYDYYPDSDLYYDTNEHLYYWREDGHWVSGPTPPATYDVHVHHYRHLRVHRRHPWEDHPVDHPAEHLHDND